MISNEDGFCESFIPWLRDDKQRGFGMSTTQIFRWSATENLETRARANCFAFWRRRPSTVAKVLVP